MVIISDESPPDWSEYVKAGIHKPSKLMVREINKAESNNKLIHLSKGELALIFSIRNDAVHYEKSK